MGGGVLKLSPGVILGHTDQGLAYPRENAEIEKYGAQYSSGFLVLYRPIGYSIGLGGVTCGLGAARWGLEVESFL